MSQITDTDEPTGEQEANQEDRFDALISLVIAIGAAFFLIGSREYMGVSSSSSDPGAALWPQVILVILLLACIINLVNIYRRNSAVADPSGYVSEVSSLKNGSGVSTETKQYLLGIVLIAAYLFVLTDIGFLVSTAIFLALFVWTLGYRSIPKVTVFSVVVTVFVFVLFRNFMNIALPYGTGMFRELGVFLEGLI